MIRLQQLQTFIHCSIINLSIVYGLSAWEITYLSFSSHVPSLYSRELAASRGSTLLPIYPAA